MNIDKLRQDEAKRIATNPAKVYWQVKALVPDGYGNMIPNPNPNSNDPAEAFFADNVMIAPMSSAISNSSGQAPAFGYSQPMMLVAPWDAVWMDNGLVIQYNKRHYRIEDVLQTTYAGGVIAINCKLTDVTPNGSSNFVIGAVLWTPTVPDAIVIGG